MVYAGLSLARHELGAGEVPRPSSHRPASACTRLMSRAPCFTAPISPQNTSRAHGDMDFDLPGTGVAGFDEHQVGDAVAIMQVSGGPRRRIARRWYRCCAAGYTDAICHDARRQPITHDGLRGGLGRLDQRRVVERGQDLINYLLFAPMLGCLEIRDCFIAG